MFKQNISFEVWGGEKGGKYRLRDSNNLSLENIPEETCDRVSRALADIESSEEKKEFWYKKFRSIMGYSFAGGGRIMANAGAFQYKKETSPINCTVMRQIPDSMDGIMQVAKEAALTLKAGCGVGYDFSTIRPKGANVFGAGAETSGIISFMKIFDAVCSTVMSGGSRRGAQMGCLDIQSPEVEEFITAKRKDGVLRYFNCSVLVNSNFMNAVENDSDWDLWFWEKLRNKKEEIKEKDLKIITKDDIPYNHPNYNYFIFDKDHNEVVFGNCGSGDIFIKKIYKTVKAKYLFDVIMKSTYEFAEPGFIIIDRMNFENNLYFCETMRATNPCFSGDTKIAVADGRNAVSIKKLAKEGKDVPVYSVDHEGNVSIKWGRNPRITGFNKTLLRITLDDQTYIDTTPDHKFLLLNGNNVEAQFLKEGDSLHRFTKSLEPVKKGGKDYYRIYCNTLYPKNNKIFEHRLIAKFYFPDYWNEMYNNAKKNGFIKGGLVVHHKDYNTLNNSPDNLQIMTFKDHSKLHGEIDQSGEKNTRFSGFSNEQIKEKAIELTKKLGRKFSVREWEDYAKSNGYPSQFSKFRTDYFGTVQNMSKSCATELGFENIDLDPRVIRTYLKFLQAGQNAKIKDGEVLIERICEGCNQIFDIGINHREQAFCSQKCSNINRIRLDSEFENTKKFYKNRSKKIKIKQLEIYSNLKFILGRDPFRKEWEQECKKNKISFRVGQELKNGFKTFKEVKNNGNNFNHKIIKVEILNGLHTVYNITVDDNHTVAIITGEMKKKKNIFYTGIYVPQCGEQNLPPNGSCLLGSMILPPYVINPFTKDADFNFDKFYEDIIIASRALDNVVEINNLPLQEMQEQILLKRRHGLGITGLGSVFNMLGLKYGSDKSKEIAEKISFTLAKASLIANIELAKEKEAAPIFKSKKSRELVLASNYLKRLIDALDNKEQIIKDIMEYGLRYSHATSIAPTGTMSLTWGNNCSNGIEPVFANSYLRNIRIPGKKTKTQEEVYDYAFFLWKEKFKDKKLPENWTTTENLSVSDHITIQAAMQKWCDSSISKTINVPTDYSFEEFKQVYMNGWKLGLKGITTFRFNPKAFSGVLVQKSDLEETTYIFKTDDGKEHKLKGSQQVEYDGEIHNVANLFDALKEGMYGDM